MPNTKESPAKQATGHDAEELIRQLTDALPIEQHLINLHAMAVGWMRNLNHDPTELEEQEQVYLTYHMLKGMLTKIGER